MRALRLADHVTKRIERVSGDENVMDEKRENMMQDHNLLMRKEVLRRGCIFFRQASLYISLQYSLSQKITRQTMLLALVVSE